MKTYLGASLVELNSVGPMEQAIKSGRENSVAFDGLFKCFEWSRKTNFSQLLVFSENFLPVNSQGEWAPRNDNGTLLSFLINGWKSLPVYFEYGWKNSYTSQSTTSLIFVQKITFWCSILPRNFHRWFQILQYVLDL